MGYRSYGNLVFPAKYLPHFAETVYPKPEHPEPNFGEWDDKVAWKSGNVDMVGLSYSSWKWYESYADIQRLEKFMGDLDELQDEMYSQNGKLFLSLNEIPEGIITEDILVVPSINTYKFGYRAIQWEWGWNRQGEDDNDFDQRGDSTCLGRMAEIDWGFFSTYLDTWGEGWVYAVRVSPEDAKKLQKVKLPPNEDANIDVFETDVFNYKTSTTKKTWWVLLYHSRLPMPMQWAEEFFEEHLGEKFQKAKDNDDYVYADATWSDEGSSYHLDGINYWEWDVYNNSGPTFSIDGPSIDFDEVLQSYMKVAKEE